jgi:methionyl aminopeptidase
VIPIKTGAEIEGMRVAGRAAGFILDELCGLVRPGITTGEIDVAAGGLMQRMGCKSAFLGYRGFPGRICISVNEEVVHGIGAARRIQYGDLVKIDVGVVKDGWVGDTARSVGVGVLDESVQRLIEAAEAALGVGIKHAVAGGRLGDLCAAIESTVVGFGYSVVREFVGHGVGRRLHEEPQIPNFGRRGTGPKLKAGMTLAIEPMVNLGVGGVRVLSDKWTVVTLDKKHSAHFEHTVLVTDGDPEVLTELV